MTGREERLAKNEAISREINEGIEDAKVSQSPEGYGRMLCECGWPDCDRVVAMTVSEYENVRRDARQFVVVHEHVIRDVEEVVAETDRFAVVRKRDGTPAEVAEQTDPRS